MNMEALEILKYYWGYDSFRSGQEQIIESALDGQDVLAVLPTGGGKSICFQVPSLLKEGIAIVVTPLIALMKDQVQNLNDRGIKALAVFSGMSRREVNVTLNNATYGDFKFLYISPERINTALFQSYLQYMNVSYIVVDESHCISQWGFDFRPDYLNISKLREFVDAPIIALTATATPVVCNDIMENLHFKQKKLIKSGFERPNLSYIVRRAEDKISQMLNIALAIKGTGIIYVRSRSGCEELSKVLESKNISASFYHAGLPSSIRAKRQEDWKSDKIRVMVCTNAFGMGIDKPDVRFVIHYDMPDSPEAYFQEAGRGGRDGLRSYAILLWNEDDLKKLLRMEKMSFPPLEYMEDIYHKVHIFNTIPYEQGAFRQLKFNYKDFCKHFHLSFSKAYYAIMYLEKTDHWTYTKDASIPARVQIMVDRNALYEIEFPNVLMLKLLEVLMRKYAGVFSYPVSINEDDLAFKLGLNISSLRQLLYNISIEHVIKYIPAVETDVLTLHHNRLYEGNLD